MSSWCSSARLLTPVPQGLSNPAFSTKIFGTLDKSVSYIFMLRVTWPWPGWMRMEDGEKWKLLLIVMVFWDLGVKGSSRMKDVVTKCYYPVWNVHSKGIHLASDSVIHALCLSKTKAALMPKERWMDFSLKIVFVWDQRVANGDDRCRFADLICLIHARWR